MGSVAFRRIITAAVTAAMVLAQVPSSLWPMLVPAGEADAAPISTHAVKVGAANISQSASPLRAAQVVQSYGKLPLSFEVNGGQVDPAVDFIARGPGYTIFLTPTEQVLALRSAGSPAVVRGDDIVADQAVSAIVGPGGSVVRMRLMGANVAAEVLGLDELAGKVNYFIGNDPTNWRTNVSTYAKVRYGDVYAGVDVVYYGNQRELEYDFVLAPGADPSVITIGIDGAERLSIDGGGDLVISLAGGEIRQRQPYAYQDVEGSRRQIPAGYVLSADMVVGFHIGAYDASRPLVIDPVLVYSSYLGGNSEDFGQGIAVDTAGSVYVTGYTDSTTFPTTSPLQATSGGGRDTFVTKINAAGSARVYSTYLGGGSVDVGNAIAVDSAGNAYITGSTNSTNFPTASPLQAALAAPATVLSDAFVTKINATGSALVYSTYLGGSSADDGNAIAVDSAGNAYVAGRANSADFPTLSPLQAASGGLDDAFVAKINAAGSLAYSTYVGGNGTDDARGIAVDAAGIAYVTGRTTSPNFPTTTGSYQPAFGGGGQDAYATKIDAAGSALLYSTYLGGSANDSGQSIAVDAAGSAYVTGSTSSTDFPTTAGSRQATFGGVADAFVTKINAAGSARVYSTYLGGSGGDNGQGIAVDADGSAYVTGRTNSTDFPTARPLQAAVGGGFDAFVTKFNAAGSGHVYSTYLGGTGGDDAHGIAVDASGNAYVTGYTDSTTTFPTASPLQGASGGSRDAFVAKISDGLYVVNAADDVVDGNGCNVTHCSLREAIVAANASPGADTISFAIPSATGIAPVISPLTELPAVTGTVTIDGTTQSGGWVALDGASVTPLGTSGNGDHGLFVLGSGSLVRGLIVTRFPGAGIRLSGGSGITVVGNRAGTDFVGGFWVLRPNGGSGVLATGSSGNTIGGTATADRNILSGNAGGGVTLVDSSNTAILGNYIGLGGDGTSDVRNEMGGVRIFSIAPNVSARNVVRGNVISAHNLVGPDSHGVLLSGVGTTENTVAGNLIGPRADGTRGFPNHGSGVLITDGASNNTIGGSAAGDRNVISNNGEHGVHIASVTSTGNVIEGNYVGLAPDGSTAMPNGTAGSSPPGAGIFLSNLGPGTGTPGANTVRGNAVSGNIAYGISILRSPGAHSISGNIVGLAADGLTARPNTSVGLNVYLGESPQTAPITIESNTISGNAVHGLYLYGLGGATLRGNRIGLAATGQTLVGNGSSGIVMLAGTGNTVHGNEIAGNGDGILLGESGGSSGPGSGSGSTGNTLSENIIRANGGAAITLNLATTTANRVTGGSITGHPGKGIMLLSGANEGIAAPVITDVRADGRLVVSGTDALPLATIAIYADPADEGQTFLGTTTALADGTWSKSSGWALADTLAVQSGLRAGTLFATATQTSVSSSTSEFSLGRGAAGAIVGRAQHRETDGTTVTTTVLPGATVRLLSGSVEVGVATADAEGVYGFSNAAGNASFSVSYKGTVGTRTYSAGVSFTTDARGNADVPPPNAVLNRKNHTWFRAYELTPGGTPTTDVIREAYQATWYKVPVTGGQRVTVRLENNPQDNVLLGYLDVRKKAEALITQSTTLPAMKTFLAGSTVAMGDLDSGDLDSGDLDSGDLDSGDLDSGDLDSGDLDSGDLDSGDLDSGDLDSGDLDSGDLDSGDLSDYNGPVYRSAQTQALRWASQHAGLATEEIIVNTRGYTGFLYFRVRGNDGVAAAPNDEFRIVATSESLGSGCTTVVTGAPTPVPSMSGVRTLLLTDTAALGLTGAAATSFLDMLRTNLATAPGVGGHVYDLSTNAGLAPISAAWKSSTGKPCVAQANAYAEAVRELVLQLWAANPLEYLVLVGGDPVVPYFRRTDTAHIARESQYGPGLHADSAGEASLVRDNLMTSDPYGVRSPVTVLGMDVSVPELGIGRIGETVEDITSYALKYRAGTGVVRDPDKLLSTGYDFTLDLQAELDGKLAARGVTTRTSLNTNTWSSEDLRNAWLRGADRYGIVSLQGHFTATRLIPADNGVRLLSSEISAVTDGRFDQRLVLTIGCHSLFNIHDSEAGLFTLRRSFPEAFMYQGATAVGNPNFGYGETVLIYNSERLMTLLVSELGYSQDPSFAAYAAGVPIGQALNNAKRAYVARIAVGALRGIDVKVLSAAVFGMPHFATALPSPEMRPADWLIGAASAGALGSPDSVSIASATSISTTPSAKNTAGLSTADVAPAWTLRRHDTATGSFYDTGSSGGVSAPYLRPIAPLASTNVHAHTTAPTTAAAGETLARGAVLLDATYSDQAAFTPRLASAPYQSATAPATVYGTSVFAPSRIFVLNQLGGGETLNVTPFQYQSGAAGTSGTARTYSAASFRVYYSTRTGSAALADPPAIRTPRISATAAGHLAVSVDVAGGPGAEIEDVYLTYTATSGPLYGRWRSLALTAVTTVTTSSGFVRTYSGTIDPQGDPSNVRLFVQAVGETGVASLINNSGEHYRLVTETATAAAPKRATTLNALTAPASATYRARIPVSATLRDGAGAPLAGKPVRFSLGASSSVVLTDASGLAATDLGVEVLPSGAPYTLVATFREDLDSLGSTARVGVTVSRGPTALTGTAAPVPTGGGGNVATLTLAGRGVPLADQAVHVTANGQTHVLATDGQGRVRVDAIDFALAAGLHEVTVRFPGGRRYVESVVTVTVPVFDPDSSVSGGGWITTATTSVGVLAGRRANFALSVRYKDGARTPSGTLVVHLKEASIDLKASAFDWMVQSTGRAEMEGSATMAGKTTWRFRAVVTDGASADTFEIWIWDSADPAASYAAPRYRFGGTVGGGTVKAR